MSKTSACTLKRVRMGTLLQSQIYNRFYNKGQLNTSESSERNTRHDITPMTCIIQVCAPPKINGLRSREVDPVVAISFLLFSAVFNFF